MYEEGASAEQIKLKILNSVLLLSLFTKEEIEEESHSIERMISLLILKPNYGEVNSANL
jgi:hypothetical protein